MARTKASVGAKVSSAKSTKARAAAPPPPPSPKTGGSGGGYRSSLAGCNAVCPRETPAWQLPITRFFTQQPADTAEVGSADAEPDGAGAGPSKPRRRAVIDSDDECEPVAVTTTAAVEPPALDTSDLPPLDGDSSHKIAEYFPKLDSKQCSDSENKENMERRNSAKRSLDEACGNSSKKAKVAA